MHRKSMAPKSGAFAVLSLLAVLATGATGATAQTPIGPASDPVVLAAGDIGQCGLQGASLTAKVLSENPGTILAVGDLAYPSGRAEDFARCYGPTWGRFKDRTYPVPGNHEYKTDDAAAYFAYWGQRAGPAGVTTPSGWRSLIPFRGQRSESAGYYSFDLGAWHIVAVNSNIDISPGSPQAAWLQADLRRSAARCKLAFFHHPLFTSGEHNGQDDLSPLLRLLHEAGVSVAINGHDHDYERFAPMDAQGRPDPDRGVRVFVVGTGGARLRPLPPERTKGSEAGSGDAWGVLKLVLHQDGYDWKFLAAQPTRFLDEGQGSCVRIGGALGQGPKEKRHPKVAFSWIGG